MSEEKIRVLFVDDDTRLLEGFRRSLHEVLEVFTADSAIDGLRALDRDGPFSVVVTDQNMPKVDGIAFLDKVVTHFPLTVPIMLSGNPDQSMLARALNTSQIFRFLSKPCGASELVGAIRAAHSKHTQIVIEKQVLEQTVSGIIALLTDLLSSLHPTTYRRSELVVRWSKAAIKALDCPKAWELETAARLWPLSYLVLPKDLTVRRDAGQPMSDSDKVKIASAYMMVAKLLNNIPRFGGVAKLLLMSCEGASTGQDAGTLEPQLLRILINLCFCPGVEQPEQAVQTVGQILEASEEQINPALAAVLPSIVKASSEADSKDTISLLAAFELGSGDLLLSDLRDDDGRLLLASGQIVFDAMLTRIRDLHAEGKVSAKFRVVRAASRAA